MLFRLSLSGHLFAISLGWICCDNPEPQQRNLQIFDEDGSCGWLTIADGVYVTSHFLLFSRYKNQRLNCQARWTFIVLAINRRIKIAYVQASKNWQSNLPREYQSLLPCLSYRMNLERSCLLRRLPTRCCTSFLSITNFREAASPSAASLTCKPSILCTYHACVVQSLILLKNPSLDKIASKNKTGPWQRFCIKLMSSTPSPWVAKDLVSYSCDQWPSLVCEKSLLSLRKEGLWRLLLFEDHLPSQERKRRCPPRSALKQCAVCGHRCYPLADSLLLLLWRSLWWPCPQRPAQCPLSSRALSAV